MIEQVLVGISQPTVVVLRHSFQWSSQSPASLDKGKCSLVVDLSGTPNLWWFRFRGSIFVIHRTCVRLLRVGPDGPLPGV